MTARTPPGDRYRAVVCDFDGVLVESEGVKDAIFEELFAAYPDHANEMLAFHALHRSLPRREKFAELARVIGRAGDTRLVDDLAARFSSRSIELISACPAVPGSMGFVRECAARGPVFVASVTPEPELRQILARRGLDRYVSRAFGDPPTTKRRALTWIVGACGGDAARVLFVGDSPDDLAAARSVGVDFIGRDSGIAFPEPRPPLYTDLSAVMAAISREPAGPE